MATGASGEEPTLPEGAMDALGGLTNEARLRILAALRDSLADASAADLCFPPAAGTAGELRYSELQAAVGIEDNGRFNYHLDKLTGTFIEEGSEGYQLTTQGVYASRVANRLHDDASTAETVRTDTTCGACGGTVEATYEVNELMWVRCPDCGMVVEVMHVPYEGAVGQSGSSLVAAAAVRTSHERGSLARGVCPDCAGTVDAAVKTPADSEAVAARRDQPLVAFLCLDCAHFDFATVGKRALVHPAVVAFYADHGIDVHGTPTWELPAAVRAEAVTVASRDPLRVVVRAERGEETLVVTLDRTAAVVDVSRE